MTTILITGAARGIGFEMARQALARGMDVIGSVRSFEDQRELATRLPQMAVLNFDVRDTEAIQKVSNAFHRPIDILVNNAGIYGVDGQTIANVDCDGLADLFNINVLAPLRVVQSFLPLVKASQSPRIVNISSRLGVTWNTSEGKIGYRASKAALNKLTQTMAEEFAGDNITCVAMHPGWVKTDMGGHSADISPVHSAAGLLDVMENLTMQDTGSFINYDGKRWNW